MNFRLGSRVLAQGIKNRIAVASRLYEHRRMLYGCPDGEQAAAFKRF